jgi:hypothetical protein
MAQPFLDRVRKDRAAAASYQLLHYVIAGSTPPQPTSDPDATVNPPAAVTSERLAGGT